MKKLVLCLTFALLSVQAKAADLTQCENTGSGLGNDSLLIERFIGSGNVVGAKITYTHNGSFFTSKGTSFGTATTYSVLLADKSVQQAKDLLSQDEEVLQVLTLLPDFGDARSALEAVQLNCY